MRVVTLVNTVPWIIWFLWCSLHCFNNNIIDLIGTQCRTILIVVNFVLRLTKCVSSWRIRSCSLRNTGRGSMKSCCRRRNWVWSWSSCHRSTKSKNWVKWTTSKKQIKLSSVPIVSQVYIKKNKVRNSKSKKEVRCIKRIRSGVKSENQAFCIKYRIRCNKNKGKSGQMEAWNWWKC